MSTAKELLTLDEGEIVFQWPGKLSQDSLDDLEGWFKVVMGRIRRKASEPVIPDEHTVIEHWKGTITEVDGATFYADVCLLPTRAIETRRQWVEDVSDRDRHLIKVGAGVSLISRYIVDSSGQKSKAYEITFD